MTLKNLAIQTALKGNWEKAITLNKSLVSEDPQDIDALNRLALAYSILGKTKEAKSVYLKVIGIDPLNAIALRNLRRLKEATNGTKNGCSVKLINNKFLEESGKTKVVELVNIAQPNITGGLRTGQSLELSVKRLKIFVIEDTHYIGSLPDDIARRLIKFIKSGCVYEIYVKSATGHKVSVFIKEIKKPGRLKDQPSFSSLTESHLEFEKNSRVKERLILSDKEEEQEEDYREED